MTKPDVPAGRAPAGSAFCTACGLQATGGAFCAGCGSRLAQTSAAVPVPRDGVIDLTEQRTIELPRQDRRTDEPVARPLVEPVQPSAAPPPQSTAEPEPTGSPLGWARRTSRGRAAVVAVAVLVVVALVGGALLAVSYFGDRDVRSALTASQAPYGAVLNDLAGADDVAAVLAVASRAASLAPTLEGRARGLSAGDDAFARASTAQLQAEAAVLAAVGSLTGLGETPLETWGAAHPALTEALDAEDTNRSALAPHDAGAVRDLPEAGTVLAGLASAVAPQLSSDAAGQARLLLSRLESATRTAELRDLAGTAAAQRTALDAAVVTLPDGPDKSTLSGMSTALASLGELGDVSGENPSAWEGSRAGVSAGITQLAQGSGDTALAASLPTALAAVDRVVGQAAAAITDWRAQIAAATEARDSDALALKEYADSFRGSMARYAQLRQDLQTFTARVEDPNTFVSPYDGFTYMSSAAEDRQAIRDSLNWMTVPSEARGAHTDVVGVIDRSIRAVQSGYDGLEQWWYCTDCDYRETPGWVTFQKESDAITTSFGSSVEEWESAVAGATASITNRELPSKPDV